MAPRTPRQRSTPSISELHRAWLELVDTEGPFLATPPLKRVWPQGMPALSDDRKAALGISDNLVRISIGVEDADDLVADFDQALAAV